MKPHQKNGHHVTTQEPTEKAVCPYNPNVQQNIIPFEPNWDNTPDFDLMQIVSELEANQLPCNIKHSQSKSTPTKKFSDVFGMQNRQYHY